MELMEDPVVDEAGHTYERDAIVEHLRVNGMSDPVSRVPVGNRLVPNIAVKQLVEKFLEDNPWAFDYVEGENWRKIAI